MVSQALYGDWADNKAERDDEKVILRIAPGSDNHSLMVVKTLANSDWRAKDKRPADEHQGKPGRPLPG